DLLYAVERLQFKDIRIALDLDGAAGHTAQIIRALLGPQHLQNEAYVGIGLGLFDQGFSYQAVVELAMGVVPIFAGGSSNADFVRHLYRNVVGVDASAADVTLYAGLIDSGVYTQASLGLLACQLALNTASAELTGLASTGIEFLPG
ncbi:MAG TPA: matrixin, partial [Aquabacterium sp.]|nr:matrixin [Aquabacterium sp.]